jgi:hypothetical protein
MPPPFINQAVSAKNSRSLLGLCSPPSGDEHRNGLYCSRSPTGNQNMAITHRMSTFGRTFAIEKITGQVLEENPWFKDMLRDWRPAGDAVQRDMTEAHKLISSGQGLEDDPGRLRLAIRNDYLNLYRGGQSVPKIGFGSGGCLQARIHTKYVHGKTGSSHTYLTLTSAGLPDRETRELRDYGGLAELEGWVANANQHVGKEKRFVDMIVARNPDTIDLEMALPAHSKERKAPRMDLVALEPVGDRWQIVFWEAKLVDDARARCRGDDVSRKSLSSLRDTQAGYVTPITVTWSRAPIRTPADC